ncbi:hypothetical protein [Atlantibacter hermannii]|uniref:hypothetical protein n=1 Tax=Atlantibacter hermannii TaxID=565 RepID=UPI0028A27C51|nr:hypothetical protein [Atlantibacter hermannii]
MKLSNIHNECVGAYFLFPLIKLWLFFYTKQEIEIMGWKRNPWAYLYDWIRGLHQSGYDLDDMLLAFEKMPYTKLDRKNEEEVAFAKVLIADALGQLPFGEIDKYILPSDVIGFSPAFVDSEGFVFTAHTPKGEDDFLFLVSPKAFPQETTLDGVMRRLAAQSAIVNKLVLQRYHTRPPYQLGTAGMIACAKIDAGD